MNTFFGAALVVVLAALSANSGVAESAREPNTPMTIGLITPLSGPRAAIGADALRGANQAIDEMKDGAVLPPALVHLRVEDSRGDPATGVAAFKKLASEGTRFIITQNSNVSLAIQPIAGQEEALQLAITTTSDRFSGAGRNSFRTNGSTTAEAEAIARYVESQIAAEQTLPILTMQDEYPVALGAHLAKLLAAGGYHLSEGSFPPHETDFRGYITRLAKNRSGPFLFLGYQTQAGTFLKQYVQLGGDPKRVIMNTPVNNKEFFEIAGSAANGVVITYPQPNLLHPAAARYRARYQSDPNFFSSNAYDAVILGASALQACNGNSDLNCLKHELAQVRDFDGLSGKKGFNAAQDMSDTYSMMVASGGRFIPRADE